MLGGWLNSVQQRAAHEDGVAVPEAPSFSQTLFSSFFLTKDEDLSNDLKYAVTALRCTAKHSTQFYIVTIYLFFTLLYLFDPAWRAVGGRMPTVLLSDAPAALQTEGSHSP